MPASALRARCFWRSGVCCEAVIRESRWLSSSSCNVLGFVVPGASVRAARPSSGRFDDLACCATVIWELIESDKLHLPRQTDRTCQTDRQTDRQTNSLTLASNALASDALASDAFASDEQRKLLELGCWYSSPIKSDLSRQPRTDRLRQTDMTD